MGDHVFFAASFRLHLLIATFKIKNKPARENQRIQKRHQYQGVASTRLVVSLHRSPEHPNPSAHLRAARHLALQPTPLSAAGEAELAA